MARRPIKSGQLDEESGLLRLVVANYSTSVTNASAKDSISLFKFPSNP